MGISYTELERFINANNIIENCYKTVEDIRPFYNELNEKICDYMMEQNENKVIFGCYVITYIPFEHRATVRYLTEDERLEKERDNANKMEIEELDLSVRSYHCLKRAGINYVYEITERTKEEIQRCKNLGKKSLREIENKLAEYGLSFNE